jgi:hypothetical protein
MLPANRLTLELELMVMQLFVARSCSLTHSVDIALSFAIRGVLPLRYFFTIARAFGFATNGYQKDNLNNGPIVEIK